MITRIIIYPVLHLIALLPFPILYLLSDFLFFISCYVIRYRKKVVINNLARAFPEKSDREIHQLSKRFYRSLSDLVMETIKLLHISKRQLKKRCTIEKNETFELVKTRKKNAIVLTAHFGNWEYAGQIIGLEFDHLVNVVFKPLSNILFNEVMRKIRTRFHNEVTPMKNTMRRILQQKDKPLITCFLADQTPTISEAGIWADFMGRNTPFFTGPEKIARKLDLLVVFGEIWKLKRGHYHIVMKTLAENGAESEPDEISRSYIHHLEASIKQQPETWLWSHRRWKYEDRGP